MKLIAEPWDCGPGGYQVGGFPPGWAEWNDKFRDTVRAFWKGEATAAMLAARLCASGEIFNHRGRKPWASVNFITAHDGFTLSDLVTYNEKRNEANAEDNKDGTSDNRSWNCGVEGPSDDKDINSLRDRQMRNMLGTLLLSQGTPMMLAGDEFARTQKGNNNAYCQDNEISWINWNMADKGKSLVRFVQRLTALRDRYPILRRGRFLTGEYNEVLELKDVAWINANGVEMTAQEWGDEGMRCFGMLMDGRAQPTGIHQSGKDATLLMIVNAYHDMVRFVLPSVSRRNWVLLIDTNMADHLEKEDFSAGDVYQVTARSFLLLALEHDASARYES